MTGWIILLGLLVALGLAVAEAYPDLKVNPGFLSLQEELSATEGRIAYARQFYNGTVMDHHPYPVVSHPGDRRAAAPPEPGALRG